MFGRVGVSAPGRGWFELTKNVSPPHAPRFEYEYEYGYRYTDYEYEVFECVVNLTAWHRYLYR